MAEKCRKPRKELKTCDIKMTDAGDGRGWKAQIVERSGESLTARPLFHDRAGAHMGKKGDRLWQCSPLDRFPKRAKVEGLWRGDCKLEAGQ